VFEVKGAGEFAVDCAGEAYAVVPISGESSRRTYFLTLLPRAFVRVRRTIFELDLEIGERESGGGMPFDFGLAPGGSHGLS
jgi:hypothetical protein